MACNSSTFEFYPGEEKKLELQIYELNEAIDCKAVRTIPTGAGTDVQVDVPTATGVLTFSLTSSPPVVVDDAGKGKISVALTATQTNQMVSGSITVRLYSAPSVYRIATAVGGIKKSTAQSC